MKFRFFTLLGVGLSLTTLSEAAETPALVVDETSFKEIYQSNAKVVDEPSVERRSSKGFFEADFGFLSVSALELQNQYYRIDYTQSVNSVPVISMGGGVDLLRAGNARVGLGASVKYGFRSVQIEAESSNGRSFTDNVQIHLLPFHLNVQVAYRLTATSPITVYFKPGGGFSYLIQTGNLDGINQNVLIPSIDLQAGVLWFGDMGTGWFQGINTGVSWEKGFSSEQQLLGWRAFLGMRVSL